MFIFCVFQYDRYTKTFLLSFGFGWSQSPLFSFCLVWSNQIAGKMYPEMDIRPTVDNLYHKNLVLSNELIKVELPP